MPLLPEVREALIDVLETAELDQAYFSRFIAPDDKDEQEAWNLRQDHIAIVRAFLEENND